MGAVLSPLRTSRRIACMVTVLAIEDTEMRDILQAYDQVETTFAWQEGDILVLDNMLVAHARCPFGGAREIYVAMDPVMSYTGS